jgi:hypothetical protein
LRLPWRLERALERLTPYRHPGHGGHAIQHRCSVLLESLCPCLSVPAPEETAMGKQSYTSIAIFQLFSG